MTTATDVGGTGYGSPYLDSLILGWVWGDGTPPAPTLTYYFGSNSRHPAWTADEKGAFRLALDLYESFTTLHFVETGTKSQANFVWEKWSDWQIGGVLGEHYYPIASSGQSNLQIEGHFNYEDPGWRQRQQGGDGFITIIHELGHGLGLEHPHDGEQIFPGVSGPWDTGDYGLNQGIWTTMSYNAGWDERPPTSLTYGGQGTPMAFDIAALQALYGTNDTYHTGDDVYRLATANASGTYWACIWDAGGVDTISNEGASLACGIDLRAATLAANDPHAGGYVSAAAGIVGGYTIANLVLIENATGGNGGDVLTGNGLDNVLTGNAGNDTLAGLAGADRLDGGAGTDTASYAGSASGVTVDLSAGSGSGGDAEGDTLTSVEIVIGSGGGDRLVGGAVANRLDGGGGDDTIEGGLGNDILIGGANGAAGDTVSYEHSTAAVMVSLSPTAAQNTGGAGTDTLYGFENLTGGDGNDVLTGSSGNNVISGGAGDDIIRGLSGADTLDGGGGNDTVSYAGSARGVAIDLNIQDGATAQPVQAALNDASGDILSNFENVVGSGLADALTGDSNDNILNGGGGSDTLIGGDGNDTLIGGGGVDDMDGGAGTSDTVSYAGSALAVRVTLAAGGAQSIGAGGDAAGDKIQNVENITGGNGGDVLTGNGLDNVLTGNAGNDTLAGLAGADRLDGGAGTDTASYAGSASGVTVDLSAGSGSGGDAEGDTLTSVEIVIGSGGGDRLVGGAVANRLDGGGGDDTIEGGLGNDILIGGANGAAGDTVSYEHSTAAVMVSLSPTAAQNTGGAGTDTLYGFENLTGGDGNDVLTGSSGNNVISGGAGDDIIRGLSGADTLDGGGGNDTVSYAGSARGVAIDLNIQDGATAQPVQAALNDASGDILSNFENVVGSGLADALTGDSNDNILNGGGGSDTLIGGDGNDTLIGGGGVDDMDGGAGTSDTVSYAGSALAVRVTLAAGGAQSIGAGGDAAGDKIQNVENITGGNGGDVLTGNGLDNVLTGNAGNDTLAGLAGADRLDGGAGTDTASYAGSASGVTVDLSAGSGSGGDAEGDTLTSVEIVIGSGGGDRLVGGAVANRLDGGGGDDTIEGGLGNDILIGGANGAAGDTVSYEHSTAAVMVSLSPTAAQNTGGAGTDTLYGFENLTGGDGNDVLTGSSGNNVISGGAGDDIIRGLSGADTLDGGGGNDAFRFFNPGEGGDVILDFNNTSEADKIGILKSGFGIGAAVNHGAAGAYDFDTHYFVADALPTEAHGQFLFDSGSHELLWDSDGTGSHAAVLIAVQPVGLTLHASDFVLV